jgi:hypothetical protein
MPLLAGGLLNYSDTGSGLAHLGGGLSGGFFSGIGGAVSDMFSADALKFKQKGDIIEAQEYRQAAAFARVNEQYVKESTDIKEFQLQRKDYETEGDISANIAANNFENSGSSIDVLRDSATQAALERGVAQQQGIIEEQAYEQQAKSFEFMAEAKDNAAQADAKAAQGATMAAYIKGAGAIFSLL